jgi:hypothetical protein
LCPIKLMLIGHRPTIPVEPPFRNSGLGGHQYTPRLKPYVQPFAHRETTH